MRLADAVKVGEALLAKLECLPFVSYIGIDGDPIKGFFVQVGVLPGTDLKHPKLPVDESTIDGVTVRIRFQEPAEAL